MKNQTLFLQRSVFSAFLLFFFFAGYAQQAKLTGEKKVYHKLSLSWEGPFADESPSTFKDYRLDVEFSSPSGKTYLVPGYFAADGKAGETGADRGNLWRAHFTPTETGEWRYKVAFLKGPKVAIDTAVASSPGGSFHGDRGAFYISQTDKSGRDFRGKGKLQYVGDHFLRFSNGEYFLKVGANSPEVFLEYAGFDGTSSKRSYPQHIRNWKSGDPSWKKGKGKGIIGVVNYLADQGLNTHYFLVMNAYGDGKQAYPWTGPDDFYQFDVSKLDQWQIVFDHMMAKGIMPQFVLTEQENQSYFEQKEEGSFADSRKLFYREMVARFGYLNALSWNIGEESGWEKDKIYGKAVTSVQRKAFADYLQGLLYYDDHVVVHNGPSDTDAIFADLLGDEDYTGLSYQGNFENPYYGHERIAYWREQSAESGHKWVVSYDEPYTNPEYPELDIWRQNSVWASLLAGAAGVEYYIGAGKDLSVEDYSLYDTYWTTLRNAHSFFVNNQLPYSQMKPCDSLSTKGWCLAKAGEVYVLYLPEGGSTDLRLEGGSYTVKWYNPRTGGALWEGSVKSLSGPGLQSLGYAPAEKERDWVILVEKQ